MLKELAECPEFLEATDRGVAPDRMGDRECVLRCLAFMMTDPAGYNEPEFDAFLSARMKDLNTSSEAERKSLADRFRMAMGRASGIFGKNAFRKMKEGTAKRQPINKAVMEAWAVTLGRLTPEQFTLILGLREELLSGWVIANNDPRFFNAVSQGTGDPVKVRLRFQVVEDLIVRLLNAPAHPLG
jgi:hypothetical protein